MMKFLLELASEEIPARMQAAAAEQLARRFTEACAAAGLAHGAVTADATPRRLWLIAYDVAAGSAGSAEEVKGPAASAPAQAIEGFLKKTGLTRDQLEERETPKGAVLFAVIRREGRAAADILAEIIPQIVRDFAWPKSMRWGAASQSTASPRWVRPLTGIVALLDDAVVPCAAHGISAGRETRGHRVHAPGVISITSAASYADQLRAAHVIVSSAERQQIIAAGAQAAAQAADLSLIPDAGLVAENAGLTEWPVQLLGRFDPAFLAVPREVIVLTMRTNQKYFALSDRSGALAPAFVCVANLEATDGGTAIIKGNERVLSARLSDARFFWEQDLATVKAGGLDAFLPKLNDIVFHEKLGTLKDKVERVAALARWLCESGAVPADPAKAERAARLAKADLVSATVGEFPEVQGIIGRYLALAAGEDPAVADAIRDHYKPAGQGDDVPTAPASVAVALADKLDTVFGFFAEGMPPTGSKDPFALRRQTLGIIAIQTAAGVPLSLQVCFERWLEISKRDRAESISVLGQLKAFFADRLIVQQREAGVRHDLITAVFDTGAGDNIITLLARVNALQSFVDTENGANLLAAYRRAANIVGIEERKQGSLVDQSAADNLAGAEPAETALHVALDASESLAREAVAAERFTDAMAALAALRAPVDAFFTDVMVNDPDPAIRARRLALLARFRDAVHGVADFSKIEG
jgi:glycyl-tRNA synthetase beta chain